MAYENDTEEPVEDSDLNGDNVPDWLIPSHVYDVLKWVALIVFPALATLVGALGPVWGFTALASNVATTLNALGLFTGVIIGASAIKANTSK
ncbi:phage holin [Bifidobacterium scaligerum]|uniref:Holin n=1 Tax=Bifidobacterium scaligerum TaxID=2052656 RepID=A0A2M9HTM9_9BIFI|nr:phage holin [Bifidobacterium scaligerum]PJM80184.1 holin [Bifidobacterium scaligerum]